MNSNRISLHFVILLGGLLVLLGGCTIKNVVKIISWTNPIRNGISAYGMKDFYVFFEDDSYYMLGTEYKNPFKGYLGLNLYKSDNFKEWKIDHQLIDVDSIPNKAWYKDGWFAPEIKKINKKYYLTFNNRNDNQNPYQKLGFGMAVSNTLYGPYTIINKAAPIVLGNNGSLTIGKNDNEVFLTYDLDGRIYIAEIDIETADLITKPKEILGPKTLLENYKYLDAPQITKIQNLYHMMFSQFYGGYVVKVFHMTANQPLGPWNWDVNNPVYTFLEAEADEHVKNHYPTPHGFAPPTQVVFSNQLFLGENGQYFNAYHSSEKYSEPYLCIEPVRIEGKNLKTINPKRKFQKVLIK